MRYRKKPVEVDAIQLKYTIKDFSEFVKFINCKYTLEIDGNGEYVVIDTLEGKMKAYEGDYIIRGVAGEFYPCKPDIFKQTYEKVGDGE